MNLQKIKIKGIEKYRWDDPFHNAQGNMQRNIENMGEATTTTCISAGGNDGLSFSFFEKKKKNCICNHWILL